MSLPSWIVEEPRIQKAVRSEAVLRDCLFLGAVALLSVVLYVFRLGLYSDDWVFLSLLHRAEDNSVTALYQALYAGDVVIRQRPVQMVYLVLFYKLFGLQPVFYHLANSLALLGSAILFYLVIREFGQPRKVALAISVVYLLLPHYSTDRFWIAAHQATFSILLYFLSLYADLRAYKEYPNHFKRWKIVSLLSMILSGLSYEVALPLFILNPFLIWYGAPGSKETRENNFFSRKFVSLFAVNLVVFISVIAFKGLITVRTNVEVGLLSHLLRVGLGALRVNFGTYGAGLPYVIGWILFHQPGLPLLVLSLILGALIFFYLFRTPDSTTNPDQRGWLVYLALGLLVFGLGYAVFAVNADVWFTSTSLGNRVAIAAAIGVAIVFVGIIGWISSLLPVRKGRHTLFCLSISMLGAAGFLINNTLAFFWIAAFAGQEKLSSELRENVPDLPAGSTLILDGVCLEQGGAYLFTGKRDLTSRLWMIYQDPGMQATVLASSAQVGEQGLSVVTYNNDDVYSYGKDLLIYNAAQKKLYSLVDVETARQYFENANFIPEKDCPPGFAWGWNDR